MRFRVSGVVRQADRQTHGLTPGAAAQNPNPQNRACSRVRPRRSVVRRTLIILVPIILDPFPYIPMHVVETPGIRWVGPDLTGRPNPNRHNWRLWCDRLAERIPGHRTGPAGIFPFGFGGQPIGPSSLLRQPGEVLRASCQPTMITGRRPRPQPTSSGFSRRFASQNRSYSSRVTGYRPMAKRRPIATRCCGRSPSIPTFLLFGRAHHESARRDHNQLRRKRRIAEHRKIRPYPHRCLAWSNFFARPIWSGARLTSIRQNLINSSDQTLHMRMKIATGIDRGGIEKGKIL